MTTNETANNEKIKNAFTTEYPKLLVDVYSENGYLNANSILYTIFIDKPSVEKFSEEEQKIILDFAGNHIFDEIFISEDDDYSLIFFGLIRNVDE